MDTQYLAFSYDDPKLNDVMSKAPCDDLRICDACGKQFLPTGRNASRMRYCQRQHYIKCAICGKVRDISLTKGYIVSTCSRKCGNIQKIKQTQAAMLAKYGVANPSQVAGFKEKARASNAVHRDETMAKIRATMVKRYGAAIPRQVPELRAKIDNTMKERYGVVNPSHSKVIREKISQVNKSESVKAKYKATSFAHYGTEYPAQNPDSPNGWNNVKDKLEATMLDSYGVKTSFQVPECKEKAKQTNLVRYGYEYVSQSPEIHRRQWNNRKNICGCDGVPLDSTWERTVYNFWKALEIDVERNIPIEFNYDGKPHMTFIDFRVNGILYEVKGNHFLTGGVEENSNLPMSVKLEVYRENHVVIITMDHSAQLFDDGSLVGVDLALFEDKFDAVYDPRTRWTVIEYLIKHKKGFIGVADFQ